MKSFSIFLAMMLLGWAVRGQSIDVRHDPFGHAGVEYAPLLLTVSGGGRCGPYQDGEMLEVGRTYKLTEVSDKGFVFAGWSIVNEFDLTEVTNDASGNSNSITSSIISPTPPGSKNPVIGFSVSPAQVIYSVPGIRTIVQRQGLQANFVQKTGPLFQR